MPLELSFYPELLCSPACYLTEIPIHVAIVDTISRMARKVFLGYVETSSAVLHFITFYTCYMKRIFENL